MKDSVEVACPSHNKCVEKSKYLELIREYQSLHQKAKEDEALYTEKLEELEFQVKFLTERKNSLEYISSKLEQKKVKIRSLRKNLKEKESEIEILHTTIKINKDKINSLRNNRQQSVDMIKDLEEEINQVKKQNSTPTHAKIVNEEAHGRRSIPNYRKFKPQTFTFDINEISEFSDSRSCDQEKFIEEQSKQLNQERNTNKELKNKNQELKNKNQELKNRTKELKNKIQELKSSNQELKNNNQELKNKNEELENDYSLQESELNQMYEQLQNLENQFFQKNTFWVERTERLRIENEDFRIRLREYQERDSGFNTSDYEGTGNLKDELSGLNTSQKSKYFDRNSQDDISFLDLKCTIDNTFKVKELSKENHKMRYELSELHYENEKLKKDIEKRKKASAELNKILIENERSVQSFISNFSFQSVSEEVKKITAEKIKLISEKEKLTAEKEKLLREIDDYRRELLKLTERAIQKKLLLKRPYLEDTIDETPEEITPRKNSFRKRKPEGYKRKRNIASWGYDLLGSSYNN